MAKKEETVTAVATVSQFGSLERPDWLKEGDVRGTENIGIADIRPPALRLAQAKTPQASRSDAKYIEGCREGDFFNTLTKQVYGEGPIYLTVISQQGHRNMEFKPLDQGGGIVDFDVKDGDPRTKFTTGKNDKGEVIRRKPIATTFYDYLVLVLQPNGKHQFMTLSLKGGQINRAKDLNMLLVEAKLPSWAYLWKLNSVAENKNNFNFMSWNFINAGYTNLEVYKLAESMYEGLKGKNIVIDTEDETPDEAAGDDKVPF